MAHARCPDFAARLRDSKADAALREQVAVCFRGELERQAARRCRDDVLAEDAAQDALLTALERLDTYRGEAPLDHWLRRLVVSACSRLRRGRKNDPTYNRPLDDGEGPADSTGADQEQIAILTERLELLREALESVPEKNRTLLLLHEGDDVPLAELADQQGTTVEAIKSRLKRTRAKLRDRLIELAEAEVG